MNNKESITCHRRLNVQNYVLTLSLALLLLWPHSGANAQPYISGGPGLGTYTKRADRNYTPLIQVQSGYIYKNAAVELHGTVPLDNNHPVSLAAHAGIYIPGNISFMLMAGTEYHYQELYKYPLDSKLSQWPVWNFSGLVRCMFNVVDAKVYLSAGYEQRMPVVGVGVIQILGKE